MYFIKISGYIVEEKVKEFTVTADSCFGKWKHLCNDLTFSRDLIHSDLCHYQSTWDDEQTYKDFMLSEDYKVLLGCFQVLGSVKKVTRGEMTSDKEGNDK